MLSTNQLKSQNIQGTRNSATSMKSSKASLTQQDLYGKKVAIRVSNPLLSKFQLNGDVITKNQGVETTQEDTQNFINLIRKVVKWSPSKITITPEKDSQLQGFNRGFYKSIGQFGKNLEIENVFLKDFKDFDLVINFNFSLEDEEIPGFKGKRVSLGASKKEEYALRRLQELNGNDILGNVCFIYLHVFYIYFIVIDKILFLEL